MRLTGMLFLVVALTFQVTFAADEAAKASTRSSGLSYTLHMSDCEDKWVVLMRGAEEKEYNYGFVYIDSEQGFTLHVGGSFTIDADGNYHPAPNELVSDKYMVKVRLEGRNGIVALLPPEALAQLGQPEKPDWLKFYKDKADPVTHKVNWGFAYNGIGDSRRALEYLEAAYKERPDAPRLVIELAYAYNALERPEDALRVSKGEFAKNPKDEKLCREMAYAFNHLKMFKEAAQQYNACLALCTEVDLAEKSELAMNLSATYAGLGDTKSSQAWRDKAKEWAPKGSVVYTFFHPQEEER